MSNSPFFQGFQGFPTGTTVPSFWSGAFARAYFVDCPAAVAAHLQSFASRQMQEQMRLASELSKQETPAAAMSRQAAYMQQAGAAWVTELMEIGELVQSKLTAAMQAQAEDTAPGA